MVIATLRIIQRGIHVAFFVAGRNPIHGAGVVYIPNDESKAIGFTNEISILKGGLDMIKYMYV